jgi:Yip1 domain
MAWDPNQGQGQGQPGSGGPDPYSGYGTPQNPYGTPPPQNPYGTPPPQYGAPPYQQGGYGYVPPQQAPRPVGQAIQELPNQYIKVVTKPSAQTFAEEMGKADWAIVWIQLLALAILGTIFGLLRSAIGLVSNPFVNTGGLNYNVFTALTVSGSTFSFIAVPVAFFIVVGIQYLLARAFQGQGNFLTQGYATLLYQVPINVASYILGLIPIFGGIAGFALFIYGIVLNVFAIMAVHRLSGGKATAVVLIPIAVLFLLVLLCIIAIAAIFFAAYRSTT